MTTSIGQVENFQIPPREPAVYALFSGDVCVYVGSTVDLRGRIASHDHTGKFDRIQWSTCNDRDLEKMERQWVEQLKPTLNVIPVRRAALTPKAWYWSSRRQDWMKTNLSSIPYHRGRGICIILERLIEGATYPGYVLVQYRKAVHKKRRG